MENITVMIPCRNARGFLEGFIPQCSWAQEVIVIDSYSSDGSAEVSREMGARVLQRTYDTSARQKNWALGYVLTEWVFVIDPDEVMEDGLVIELLQAVHDAPDMVDALLIPMKHHYGSYWLRHGGLYPSLQARVFRASRCRWEDRYVHAHLLVKGQTQSLKHHLLHYQWVTIDNALRNLDRYSGYECDELLKRGRTMYAVRLIYHPLLVFLYRYLWLRGFLDGWRGLVLGAYTAVYDFLRIVKVLEVKHGLRQEGNVLPSTASSSAPVEGYHVVPKDVATSEDTRYEQNLHI